MSSSVLKHLVEGSATKSPRNKKQSAEVLDHKQLTKLANLTTEVRSTPTQTYKHTKKHVKMLII